MARVACPTDTGHTDISTQLDVSRSMPPKGIALDAELSQMMIDVLVHENGPLLRFERTEERVWVLGAARRAHGSYR